MITSTRLKLMALMLLLFLLSNCKKSDISNYIDSDGNTKGKPISFDRNIASILDVISLQTNAQLKLGILDSLILARIDSLTLDEQKAFWYIISDIEVGVFEENGVRVHSADLNIYPFPMIEANSPSTIGIGFSSTPSNLYIAIPNPHFSLYANKIRNLNNLIDAMPLIIGYMDIFTKELLYSIVPANDGSPYFSVVGLSGPIVEDSDNPVDPGL